jgi:hypothetical protein
MRKGTFVLYNGVLAVVVRDGVECSAEAAGELDDHVGVWFGELADDGRPIVWTIPLDCVLAQPVVAPEFAH